MFRQRHEGQAGHYSFWSFMGGARARNVGWRSAAAAAAAVARVSHCIRLDYALASSGVISSIEHVCYDHTFAASDHCPMHIDIAKSLFPAKTEPASEISAQKQKGIAAFFKKAK